LAAAAVGVLDHHDGRFRDVYTNLDHRRGHQDLQFAGAELGHHLFLLPGWQSPMKEHEPQAGERAVGQADEFLAGRGG
jgi:hypothetical protein